ncbi:MAG: FHA domain-containing protein [Planctomycetia bacterium]
MEGTLRGQEVHVHGGETFLIGRDDHCKLRLHASKVSRVHCVITHGAEGFVVRDCMSRNGTFLNDKRLGTIATSLHRGDILRIGPFVFRVEVSTEPKAVPRSDDGSTIHWIG